MYYSTRAGMEGEKILLIFQKRAAGEKAIIKYASSVKHLPFGKSKESAVKTGQADIKRNAALNGVSRMP